MSFDLYQKFNKHCHMICKAYDKFDRRSDKSLGQERYANWGVDFCWRQNDYRLPGFQKKYVESLYVDRCVEQFELANQVLQQIHFESISLTDIGGGPGNCADAIARWCEWKFDTDFLDEHYAAKVLEVVDAWNPAIDTLKGINAVPNLTFELVPDGIMEMPKQATIRKDALMMFSVSHVLVDFLPKAHAQDFWANLVEFIETVGNPGVILVLDRFHMEDWLATSLIRWCKLPQLGGKSRAYIGIVNFELPMKLVRQPLAMVPQLPATPAPTSSCVTTRSERFEPKPRKLAESVLLWGTAKGECFHTNKSCHGLRNANRIINVQVMGRRPCKLCAGKAYA